MPSLLIADDSMFQRFMHAKAAKEEGFDVLEAKDGQECLDLARANCPDIILLDLNMPEVSGMEVLQALAEEKIAARILVITADIQETTRKRCLELGVKGFVNKPVEEAELKLQLKAALT